MTGNEAFRYLAEMTVEQRKAVRIMWFGPELVESLQDEDAEEKGAFFGGLSYEEQGKIIEDVLFPGSDFSKEMIAFFDEVNSKFELELERRMREDGQDGSNNKQQQGENDR